MCVCSPYLFFFRGCQTRAVLHRGCVANLERVVFVHPICVRVVCQVTLTPPPPSPRTKTLRYDVFAFGPCTPIAKSNQPKTWLPKNELFRSSYIPFKKTNIGNRDSLKDKSPQYSCSVFCGGVLFSGYQNWAHKGKTRGHHNLCPPPQIDPHLCLVLGMPLSTNSASSLRTTWTQPSVQGLSWHCAAFRWGSNYWGMSIFLSFRPDPTPTKT